MTPSRDQVANIKQGAQRSFKELREFYEQAEREFPDSFPKLSRNILKAQMRVWAGVYNRDYGEYKQGVDQYERYTRTSLRREEAALEQGGHVVPVIAVSGEKAEEYGVSASSGITHASPGAHRDMYERKLIMYKGLYNDLPRGYFRSQ